MKCLNCGKPIEKATQTVYLRKSSPHDGVIKDGATVVERFPQTKAEAQRMTNETIISVARERLYDSDTETWSDGGIRRFATWDGKSYSPRYRYFCTNHCAGEFGRLAAQQGLRRKAKTEAA
jgi:hypothetical protein